jgi:uncharacterized protein
MDIWQYSNSMFGGSIIGVAAVLLLLLNGRILGISGIAANIITGKSYPRNYSIGFVCGLLIAGVFSLNLMPGAIADSPVVDIKILALAGLLVGVGTRIGNGCTSGHGVCGLSRFSKRSLVATLVFMLTAAITVYITHHIWELV